ncbi:hypothetical protein PR202_gb25960 [Eleusine coracana subsp. coracana]|uniref:Uncharacterized protein n=1 Tax=Eleusine coracana subsp. coracana TaxID=191504 RepID=A0AAV5FQL9_ELECO|nr:hypothetical protein PR202_gb25960 [Eleusine coracana subsp. coracana]
MGEERKGGEEDAAAAARAADQARELQDAAAALLTRTRAEEEALRRRAAALQEELRRLRKAAAAAHADSDKVEEDLDRATCLISDGDIASLLPSKTHGVFLKMFLGPVNLRATRKEVQLKVKEEYNSYRDRTALLFLGFPVILLCLRSWLWNGCFPALPVQLYQAWLLFLYTTLALRENILRVNGSDIRACLTWEIKGQPDCARKQAKRMDVVWGETAGVEGQLLLLCPLLFLLQGFEGYVGFLLLRTATTGTIPEWQVVVCGILLIAMAIGNFANTVDTLMAKSRFKAKMKKSKSKRDLDTCTSPKGSLPTDSTVRA